MPGHREWYCWPCRAITNDSALNFFQPCEGESLSLTAISINISPERKVKGQGWIKIMCNLCFIAPENHLLGAQTFQCIISTVALKSLAWSLNRPIYFLNITTAHRRTHVM